MPILNKVQLGFQAHWGKKKEKRRKAFQLAMERRRNNPEERTVMNSRIEERMRLPRNKRFKVQGFDWQKTQLNTNIQTDREGRQLRNL